MTGTEVRTANVSVDDKDNTEVTSGMDGSNSLWPLLAAMG